MWGTIENLLAFKTYSTIWRSYLLFLEKLEYTNFTMHKRNMFLLF